MARNVRVNLTKRVTIEDGSTRYFPVVEASANGRMLDKVSIDGKQEHRDGTFYLDWHEGTRRLREAVGQNVQDAQAARLKKQAELNARAHGITVTPENGSGRRPLSTAISEYLSLVQATKKPKTHAVYAVCLGYFQEFFSGYVEEITRDDLQRFKAFLRDKKELSDRSVFNKFAAVTIFLTWCGLKLTKKGDNPKYTKAKPEIYEQAALEKLFAAADKEERMRYQFFLMTGMREQEVMQAEWSDINWTAKTVSVTAKPARGWKPKDYEEREIPVPDKLLTALQAWKKQAKGELIFPSVGSPHRPNRRFLENLKATAKMAGLDPDECYLHKFRATFATRHLWAGVDLATVQSWMGHSDLASTMRYLRPQRSDAVRERVNASFA